MKELKITIAGKSATGKSTVMLMLEEFLLEKGFKVNVDLEIELNDFGTEKKFREVMSNNNEDRIDSLTENVVINLKQKQTVAWHPNQ